MNSNILDRLVAKSLRLANANKFRHFSYLLLGKKIVSIGLNNMKKTHPLGARYNSQFPYIHSEINSIVRSDMKVTELKNCTMVNIRLGKKGGLLLSRPCNSCARILADFQIGEVLYSNQFGNFEQMIY